MITRNLHQPTHGSGRPVTVANAHGQMVYGPHLVGQTPTLNMPPESIMYDPSNPPSDPYEQHYQTDASSLTPVASRQLYFATGTFPYNESDSEPTAGSGLPVGTRPAV
jgi:hypothetical protein